MLSISGSGSFRAAVVTQSLAAALDTYHTAALVVATVLALSTGLHLGKFLL